MKGDFSRDTFKPEKHYSGVRMQQGRVLLDADWNEQIDIVNHRVETDAVDAIGHCGAPKDNAGFKLDVDSKELVIFAGRDKDNKPIPGRFYVDGVLCEIDKDYKFTEQPDLPNESLPAPALGDTYFLAYLDVWQRHLTVLDDSDLHEVALEAPDTTTRTKTVWQVKLLPLGNILESDAHCGQDFEKWKTLVKTRVAPLAVQTKSSPSTSTNPCAALPPGGFNGIANQLYRVEIHQAGKINEATFKWSRDNGSIVGRVNRISLTENTIEICEPPRDDRLAFQRTDWVEVINDEQELKGKAGILVRLNGQTGGIALIYDPDSATGALPEIDPNEPNSPKDYKVRKWHNTANAEITASGGWQKLGEDGIEVKFGDNDEQTNLEEYQVGDYWLIPARTTTRNVVWPVENNSPKPLAPFGIKHHYCRLAICKLDKDGNWHVKNDCRPIFSPLAEQINLFYLSGDGQEAMPGEMLPQPLRVGVTNGLLPVAGVQIKFEVKEGEAAFTKIRMATSLFLLLLRFQPIRMALRNVFGNSAAEMTKMTI